MRHIAYRFASAHENSAGATMRQPVEIRDVRDIQWIECAEAV
ncbi:MAG TPA: hypothetical protein VKQ28_14870 [Candidatus Acidoferrum sp.]|nr:hypothetical protein [Candidatus Acidoferrum sp.]